MKNLIVGLLAHVDAGKTTLSEALLYESDKLKKIGRVDNKDAFLDTDEMERERGITIFSKQAAISFEEMQITLMDTPGHVDFSAEMERTLQVLDAMGFTNYQVTDKEHIHIFERLNESAALNMELAKAGIPVKGLSITSEELETYFLNLTGGASHA